MLVPKTHLYKQPFLYSFHSGFPFRYTDNMPPWVASRICTCDQFGYGSIKKDPDAVIYDCENCGLYNVTFLFMCIDCDTYFLKDFKHPRFCVHEHFRCWGCLNNFLEQNDGETCCDRVKTNYNPRDAIRPPLGIKFVRMSMEEADAILGDDFDLSFDIS